MSARPPTALLSPPDNFSLVESNIYRSAYPTKENVPFLRNKGIKTIALLSIESLAPSTVREIQQTTNNREGTEIRIVEVADIRNWFTDSINGREEFSQQDVYTALHIAIDTRWHPVLFTCPTGEVQTSVIVGCFRRIQHWTLTSIIVECELFSNFCPTVRPSVLSFISEFNANTVSEADLRYRSRVLLAKLKNSKELLAMQRKRKEKELRKHIAPPSDSETLSSSSSTILDSSSEESQENAEESEARGGGEWKQIKSSGRRPPSSAWRHAKAVPKRPASNLWLAPWFIAAQEYESKYGEHLSACREVAWKSNSDSLTFPKDASGEKESTLEPLVRYAGVRHPPAVSSKAKYTKESILDDDKD